MKAHWSPSQLDITEFPSARASPTSPQEVSEQAISAEGLITSKNPVFKQATADWP